MVKGINRDVSFEIINLLGCRIRLNFSFPVIHKKAMELVEASFFESFTFTANKESKSKQILRELFSGYFTVAEI